MLRLFGKLAPMGRGAIGCVMAGPKDSFGGGFYSALFGSETPPYTLPLGGNRTSPFTFKTR
jgi:hypothetical protein